MADLELYFHALPDELAPLLQKFVAEERVHLCAIRFQPFQASRIEPDALPSVLADAAMDRIMITRSAPRLEARMNALLDSNLGALTLTIGHRTSEGLQDTWLAARTEHADELRVWQKLRKAITTITRTGVTGFNPETGASGPARNRRFSAGAKALERDGVAMLAAVGKAHFRFAD